MTSEVKVKVNMGVMTDQENRRREFFNFQNTSWVRGHGLQVLEREKWAYKGLLAVKNSTKVQK